MKMLTMFCPQYLKNTRYVGLAKTSIWEMQAMLTQTVRKLS